jgi:glycolate oxidase
MLNFHPNVTQPSQAALERALLLLHRALGPSKVLSARESCEVYSHDDSEAEGRMPDAVVLASSAEDIATTLRIAEETAVPVTPRGGGTGRVGGAVPSAGGIVLSTLGMKQVKEIDRRELLAVVEPGLVLADLHAAVEAEGLFYPPDANSLLACAIGGNVATNARGPRAFKYGVTRNYVLGVEATLIGGRSFFAGRRTTKGVTGYDVTSLLVGSEGTLAVFGDITLRLIAKPESVMTLMALFPNIQASCRAVESIIVMGLVPRCIELLDHGTLEAVRRAGNALNAQAGAMLLMEVDGPGLEVERQAARVGELCDEAGALEVLVAQDAGQRDRLWAARREMSPAVRRMAKHKLSEDVVVPRGKIAELLLRVARTGERLQLRNVTYGHAGDGNLHVNFLWDDESEVPRVEQGIEQLFRDVVELRGTLSGEHGVGLMKAPYLHLEQSETLIELQRGLKNVFDPHQLLNPGKIFSADRSHGAC